VKFFSHVLRTSSLLPATTRGLLVALILCLSTVTHAPAATPAFTQVVPGKTLKFPRDFGAHPDFRTEWWYATGWLQTPDGKSLGFQVTFFRSATEHDAANQSRFAPKQLIVAHAALSDPAMGKLVHDQKIARAGFGLAQASEVTTDVKLHQWTMRREADGRYQIALPARDFTLSLTLTPTQPVLLQGEQGYSRKGPVAGQASYYYSEPQLKVTGQITRKGKPVTVQGSAWLDHEWSSTLLDPRAVGWDWVGTNLDDGSALMAFRIRTADGQALWQHATLRDANGKLHTVGAEAIRFTPLREWRSPRTGARYPVAMQIDMGDVRWRLTPLQDDQELDSRQSTGAVYWEGAVTIERNGKPAGRGYFEMTGYLKALKL
jgi:predicted secreted hydrolase